MLFEKILGNLDELESTDGYHFEKIYLNSDDLVKRILRVKTDHNNEHGISLDKSAKLRDGDILFNDGHNLIIVKVKDEDVLVIKPKDITEMAYIAHKLGNKHLPAQFENDVMIVQYDYLVEEELRKDNINYSRENREVKAAFTHVNFMEHKH